MNPVDPMQKSIGSFSFADRARWGCHAVWFLFVLETDCVVSLPGKRQIEAGLLCKSLSVSGVEQDEMDGSEQRLDVQTSEG